MPVTTGRNTCHYRLSFRSGLKRISISRSLIQPFLRFLLLPNSLADPRRLLSYFPDLLHICQPLSVFPAFFDGDAPVSDPSSDLLQCPFSKIKNIRIQYSENDIHIVGRILIDPLSA